MASFTARANAGRLTLNVPTDLPDGAVLELVPAETWDDLDEAERIALEADLESSGDDFEAGRVEPLADLIAVLRSHR